MDNIVKQSSSPDTSSNILSDGLFFSKLIDFIKSKLLSIVSIVFVTY